LIRMMAQDQEKNVETSKDVEEDARMRRKMRGKGGGGGAREDLQMASRRRIALLDCSMRVARDALT
jgi:hypothetical protein